MTPYIWLTIIGLALIVFIIWFNWPDIKEPELKRPGVRKFRPGDEFADCGHNVYWLTVYQSCMACRAERAEKILQETRNALLESMQTIAAHGNGLAKARLQNFNTKLEAANGPGVYIAIEDVQEIADILREHHLHAMESLNVFFEQDGKPIDVAVDLGDAYGESDIYERTDEILHRARLHGVKFK